MIFFTLDQTFLTKVFVCLTFRTHNFTIFLQVFTTF